MIETPPDKRDALSRLLDGGPAMIHLDPRHDGVLAPPELCSGPALRLKLSWHYAHPLHLDDEGVVQTLTFHSGSFRCAVPWEAIFAMGSAESTFPFCTNPDPGTHPERREVGSSPWVMVRSRLHIQCIRDAGPTDPTQPSPSREKDLR